MNQKAVLKIVSSMVLIVCMLINVFAPCMGVLAENMNSSAATMSFPAPIFKDSPEYSYEIPTPNVNIGVSEFEKYTPNMSESVGANAPIISGVTAIAGPNDSVSIQGEGFTGGTVWVYGLDKEGNGMFTVCETTFINDTTVNAIINEKYRFGMFLFWVESASGVLSRPIRVNAPEITWTSVDAASQGTKFYLYGKNLTKNNVDGDSNVYFTNGTKSYKAQINDVNAYRIEVTVPESIADGDYKLWVHNGHGGAYGWSNGLDIKVQKNAQNLWTGKTITVSNVAELKNAINNAADRDTIFLKNGTYLIDDQVGNYNAAIVVKTELRFVGESRDGVVILSSPRVKGNSNAFSTGSNCFAILKYPSEFKNITFQDNVADFKTFDIANVRSVFLKAWGWHAKYSFKDDGDYFKVDSCTFKVNRLNHGKGSDNVDPQIDAMLREKYGDCYSGTSDRSEPLYIDYINNAYVINCHFEASVGFSLYGGNKAIVQDCTSAGNWIQYGNSGSCFCYFFNTKNIDLSRNKLHGKDLYTDPDGKLERYDLGFGRVVVVQNANESTNNSYFAENDIRRNGEFDGNSGEVFLYECLSTEYFDKISGVSADGKTITLTDSVWVNKGTEESPSYQSSNNKEIIGATVTVFGGKGESQYRRIVGVTADNNVIVDRPFDVSLAPSTAVNASVISISRVEENSVIFRNYVEGPDDWEDNYNSTAGVQAYATMLDYIGAENYFTQLHTGFYCDMHYNATEGAISGFNGFEDTIIFNNVIEDVRDGIDVNFNLGGLASGGDADILEDSNPVSMSHNIMLRNNRINHCIYCEDWKYASNGVLYDAMLDRGANGIAVGQLHRVFNLQQPNPYWNGDWHYGTIIENNNISNAVHALINLRHAQGNTVIRNNYCQGRGDEEDVIVYEPVRREGYPEVNRAIMVNNYGNLAEGVYGTASNLESFDELQNGNFAEGLKYWASNSGKGYAADNASIVDGAVKVSSTVGITSVDFKPQNVPANSKVAVVYDWSGSENVRVELNGYGLQTVSRDKLNTFTNSDVANGWSRTINNYTLTTTEDLDLNVVIYSLDGTSAEIDNIEFVIVNENQGYYETADGRRYNLLDGSVYGGTAQNGIVSNNADDIYKYGYTEGLANASFSEGLKFWQKSGTATSTISANGGKLVFSSAARYNGVISAPFKVVNSNFADTNNRLAVMLDYTAITTTGSYYSVNLYETVNGTTTKYPLTITAGVTTANTNGFSGAYSSTISWKENAIYNLEIVANRNTFKSEINEVRLARYDGSALTYTDMLSGEIYKNNTTAKKLENLANINNNTVAEELKNGDFSDGNAYWYGTSTVTDGKLTPSANVTSLPFKVNANVGDRIAVMFDYVATANATVTFAGSTTASKTVSKGSGSNVTSTTDFSSAYAYKITLSAGATYDNIRVVVVNADGTYTDTITGEIYGSDFETLGGSEADGYYSVGEGLSGVLNAPCNLDFSQGFRYWTSKHDRTGYASSQAICNSDGSVTISANANYDGISSMKFKIPCAKVGMKYYVTFEAIGEVSVDMMLYRSSTSAREHAFYTADANNWVKARTSYLTINAKNEEFSISFQNPKAGTSVTFKNLHIVCFDMGGLDLTTDEYGAPRDAEYGDANADGRIDLADLVAMKKYAADASNKIYVAAANVDRDANISVTATDISCMQNYILTGNKEF